MGAGDLWVKLGDRELGDKNEQFFLVCFSRSLCVISWKWFQGVEPRGGSILIPLVSGDPLIPHHASCADNLTQLSAWRC